MGEICQEERDEYRIASHIAATQKTELERENTGQNLDWEVGCIAPKEGTLRR